MIKKICEHVEEKPPPDKALIALFELSDADKSGGVDFGGLGKRCRCCFMVPLIVDITGIQAGGLYRPPRLPPPRTSTSTTTYTPRITVCHHTDEFVALYAKVKKNEVKGLSSRMFGSGLPSMSMSFDLGGSAAAAKEKAARVKASAAAMGSRLGSRAREGKVRAAAAASGAAAAAKAKVAEGKAAAAATVAEHKENRTKAQEVKRAAAEEEAKSKKDLLDGTWVALVKFLSSKDGMGKEITVMFKELDADKSGDVDIEEFVNGMKKLGLKLRDEQFSALYADMDANHDKKLTLKEFTDGAKRAKLDMDARKHALTPEGIKEREEKLAKEKEIRLKVSACVRAY